MEYSVDDLLRKAEQLVFEEQYEIAFQFYERALSFLSKEKQEEKGSGKRKLYSTTNTDLDRNEEQDKRAELLESYGFACMEADEPAKALGIFKQLTKDYLKRNPENWMSLAQLQTGKEAVQSYLTGLELYAALLESMSLQAKETANVNNVAERETPNPMMDVDDQEDQAEKRGIQEVQEQMCSGYCSLAELYLTDLCFEPDAEGACEKYLTKAASLNPSSPEVSQLFCSFYISRKQPAIAKQHILKALEILNQASNLISETEPFAVSFEFKVTTARLLVELKEYHLAAELLAKLLEENESIVEPWILITECYIQLQAIEYAAEAYQRGRALLEQYLKVQEYKDSPIFKEQLERFQALDKRLSK